MFKKFLIFALLSLLLVFSIRAQDTTDLQKKISEYQEKLSQLGQQRSTLSSQIQYMDTQIYLTTLQINQTQQKIIATEKEIEKLGSRIEGLDESLTNLSELLIQKVVEGYKQKSTSLFDLIFDSNNASELLAKIKYVKTARDNNQKLLIQVQETKSNAEEQKKLREEKKVELDQLTETLNAQSQSLNSQKATKQRILTETQNSERVYQDLLAKAQAEYAAIQGIVAGAGTETQIREVKKGDVIGTVISGVSCNSTGSHLHFTVKEGNSVINPFNKLKNVDHFSYTNDPWTPSGDWDWPISPTIQFNQGYGITSFVQTYGWYPFHNGLDISSSSYNIYAVADGTLYRGAYSIAVTSYCSTGVLLYTKVVHKDSNISTLYLHTYTQ